MLSKLRHCTRTTYLRGSLRPERQSLVRNLIYPMPDPSFRFLGVHFTRLTGGGVEAEPNAVLAFAQEGYRKTDVNPRDLLESLTFPGLWRHLKRYPQMCGHELLQSLRKERFADRYNGWFQKSPKTICKAAAREYAPGRLMPTAHFYGTFVLVTEQMLSIF